MKKLLGIVVLGLLLITPSQADDIRDFEIEGMSIGDSLLDYFSEKEINDNIEKSYTQHIKKEPGKFLIVEFRGISRIKIYDALQFAIKKNDKNYKIYMVKGMIAFTENISECYKKQVEIDNELSELFNNLKREVTKKKHPIDESGKSIVVSINYWFPTEDLIEIDCFDWSEEIGHIDHLRIGAKTKEINKWLP